MRLAPVDRPRGLVARIAHLASRRMFGKVIAPMRTVYPRLPGLYRANYGLLRLEQSGLSLDEGLRALVKIFVASRNGCGFCLDIGRAMSVGKPELGAKLEALDDWRNAPALSAAERAALAFAEAATTEVHVKDAVYDELRRHFDERQAVEIAFVVALENYLNRMAAPFGLESDGLCEIAAARAR